MLKNYSTYGWTLFLHINAQWPKMVRQTFRTFSSKYVWPFWNIWHWGLIMEVWRKEMNFFSFCNFDLFDLIFLLITYKWFPKWFKTKARFGFRHQNFFLKLSIVKRKGSKKAWFRENLFRFQIFQTFGNLEITWQKHSIIWIISLIYKN